MKIVKSEEDLLEFDNGIKIEGEGDVDCCANNYLDFENFPVGTEFPDMTLGQLIDTIKLKDDGFILKDSQKVPHWAQARSYQNEFYMRDHTLVDEKGNKLDDTIIKKDIYEQWIKPRFNVRFVLDDRDRVVKMWREQGLKVLQVAEGDF